MKTFSRVMVVCSLLPTVAVAGPGEEAIAVVDQWATTYSANDRDALVRLYTTDALLFGTTEKNPVRGSEGIRDYFVGKRRPKKRNSRQERIRIERYCRRRCGFL